jgi:hypothetical protein
MDGPGRYLDVGMGMGMGGERRGERREGVGWRALGLGERVFETVRAEIKGSAHDLKRDQSTTGYMAQTDLAGRAGGEAAARV